MNTPPRLPLLQAAEDARVTTRAPMGQMTSVMRTLAVASGPRIPRIAIVQGGRILDEHLIRDASSVTIGTSEHARIVVKNGSASQALPASFELLERVGDRYFLRFTEAMTGRVTGPTGIASLSDLRSIAHVANGAYRVPLAEDARGKIVIGETTFLFQLVVRPPASPRPQLPLSVKNSLPLDWSLTIIVAFSFLLHFGIAGAMYSDWMDPVVTTDYAVSGLIDDLARLPKPVPQTLPDTTPADDTNVAQAPAKTASNDTNKSTPTKTSTRHSSTSTSTSSSSVSDRDAAKLVAQAEQLEIDHLTVKANGSSVRDALARDNIPTVDMSEVAKRNVGVAHDPGELKMGPGGPVVARKSSGLPGVVADNTKNTSTDKAGVENGPAGPTISVDTAPPKMNGVISDADSVIAKLRPRFRKCYQDGLNIDPTMSGKAVLAVKIGPNGEVQSTSVESNEGLSQAVTGCMQKAIGNATFTGNGNVTTMRVPVTMLKQQR